MPIQALRIIVLLSLVATGAVAFRKKKKDTDAVKKEPSAAVDATLRERSGSAQSFAEEKQVSLDEAVLKKGDNRRRRRHSSNGWCLPHQQCTYFDCCSAGTSCNTCPAGYHGEKAFGRCALKGHFVCNSRDCTGQWGAWSGCSAQCGGGTRQSTYTYVHRASSGGSACPHHDGETKTEHCNTHACPVDCVGAWTAFDNCTARCGGGHKRQYYQITTHAEHGGQACPHHDGEMREETCNTQVCCPEFAGLHDKSGKCVNQDTDEEVDPSCCNGGQ